MSLRILPTELPLLYIFSSLKFVKHVSSVNILCILFKNVIVIKFKNWKWFKKTDKLKTDNSQQLHDVSPKDVWKMSQSHWKMYVKVFNQTNELAKCLNLNLTIFWELRETLFSEHQFLDAFIFNWFLFCSGLAT